jgi:hypothetical protein
MGELMRKPYDWSEDVKKLTMPVMLVYGDSDMYRPEHIVKFYQLLGGGLKDAGWQRENMSKNRLAILPDLTHYDIFLSPDLPRTVLPFLNRQERPRRAGPSRCSRKSSQGGWPPRPPSPADPRLGHDAGVLLVLAPHHLGEVGHRRRRHHVVQLREALGHVGKRERGVDLGVQAPERRLGRLGRARRSRSARCSSESG